MSPAAPNHLHAWSFHSVKGGVGKSTLAVLVARRLAQSHRVALIDMDLTGTSLADVLPLRAPYWSVSPGSTLPLEEAPARWDDPSEGLRARGAGAETEPKGVPFLNDWFLHARDVDYQRSDICAQAIAWKDRLQGQSAENLWVLPSSGLPGDIARVLPLLYDEPFAAYVEGRLEWLLDALLREGVQHVVFDTPPTLPGLSKAVLSMALRLPVGQPMSKTGTMPHQLEETAVCWQAWIVATQDVQDLLAVERWLEAVDLADAAQLGVVLNRCDADKQVIRERLGRRKFGTGAEESAEGAAPRQSVLFDTRRFVLISHRDNLRLFDVVRDRPVQAADLEELDNLIGADP